MYTLLTGLYPHESCGSHRGIPRLPQPGHVQLWRRNCRNRSKFRVSAPFKTDDRNHFNHQCIYVIYIYRDILKVSPQKMESLIPIVFGDDHVLFMVHLMRTSSTSSTWWVFRCRVWSPEGIWSAFWNHTILGGITPISSGGQCNLRSLQFVQTVIGYIRLYPMCSYFPLLLLCALPCKLPTTRWN